MSPFHAGERDVQARVGVGDTEDWARGVIRPYLSEQHRAFHSALPFIVAGARDDLGRPWATVLGGKEGFITSPDPQSLVIDAKPVPGDALEGAFNPGADVGLLGIEFATRRRNRLNGRIVDERAGLIRCFVDQAFGNCPQYIRERQWRRVATEEGGKARRGARLNADQRRWIAAADTFFIASGYRGEGENTAFGMDVSHRGGDAGFVQVLSDSHLVFPDYAGNNYFNTIGNLSLDPRAGLLFVDFESGSLLQLTVCTSIDWDSPVVSQFPGARRLVRCEIVEIVELRAALPLRWDGNAALMRALRLVEKIAESDDVTSFIFAARDGGALADFEAGQHLHIELAVSGYPEPVRRTYSLSNSPGDGHYRISVKREPNGIASCHLHDRIAVGSIVNAHPPAGEFVLGCTACPIALISAGIGVTPMVSMLRALSEVRGERPVWFIHGARDGRHHPLARDVREAVARQARIRSYIAYSRPRPDDRLGVDFDREGHVDGVLVASLLSGLQAEYYLCGPPEFMADIQSDLEGRSVSPERIHTESFGAVR